MSTLTRNRRINLYINGKQIQNDIKSITAEMTKLQNKTKTLEIGSLEYVNNMKKIRELKGIIYEHNQALNATNHSLLSLKGLANAFNKYWPVIMGTIGTITGLIFSVKSVTDSFAQFDDKIADIMKTTGLSREEVLRLNEAFKKIDTRTAQSELLDLAYVAGKLGITAEEDILGFVRASDKIVVALQKDLGGSAEDAINTLGKLVQVFKLREQYGMEEALIKVGSAINSLGMASSANEQNIVSFSKRVAGIGKLAGISIPDILGLGATIDALAISTEVASTAYSMFMGRMTQDTATFATITGMQIEDFVELLNTDANEAFIRVLESLSSNEEGFTALRGSMEAAGLDGERAVAVMSTLSQQTDFLRQQQDLANKSFLLGTSVLDEFNIKNNTAQARIEKNTKAIENQRIELGEKLMPVYASGQSTLVKFYKVVGVLAEFFYNHGKTLAVAASAMLAYKAAMIVAVVWNERLLAGTRAFAIAEAFSSLQTKLATKWLLIKGIAYDLYRKKVTLATAATEIFTLALGMTGIPALVALLATVATSFWMFSNSAKDASREILNLNDEINRLTKEKQESIIREQMDIKTLLGVINNLNQSSQLRIKLLDELKKKYPELIGYIQSDKVAQEELNDITKLLNDNIHERINLAALEAKAEATKNKMVNNAVRMLDIQNEILDVEKKYNKIQEKRKLTLHEESWRNQNRSDLQGEYNKLLQEQTDIEADFVNIQKNIQDQNVIIANQATDHLTEQIRLLEEKRKIETTSENPNKDLIASYNLQISQIKKQLVLKKQQQRAEDLWNEVKENEEKNAELKRYNRGEVDKFTHEQNMRKIELKFLQGRYDNYQFEADKRIELANDIEKKIAEIREAYDKADDKTENFKLKKDFDFQLKSTQLLKDFLAGKIETQRDYEDQLLQLEIDSLTQKLTKEKEGTEDYVEIDAQLQTKLLEQTTRRLEYEKALISAAGVDEIDITRQKYQQMLIDLGIFGMRVEDMTEAQQRAYSGIIANANAEFNQIDAFRTKEYFENKKETYQNELNAMKMAHTQQLNEVGNDREKRKALRITQSKELVALTKKYFDEIQLLIEKYQKSGELTGVILSDDIISPEEREELNNIMTEIYGQMGKIKEKFASDFGLSNQDILGFSLSDWDTFIKKIGEDWDGLKWEDKFEVIAVGLLAVSDLYSQFADLQAAYEERAMNRLEERYNGEKKAISKKLEFGLISQENYNAQVEKMDRELARKKAEIQRQQAIREKANAIFEATIYGALAVVKSLENPILAFIVGGLVAAQITMIAATPLPEIPGAEAGGSLIQRSQDGKVFNASVQPGKRGFINRPTVIVSEDGEEYVVPGTAMRNPTIRPVLEMLEMARLNNNLATVNFNDMLLDSIYNGRASGGYAQKTTSIKSTNAENVFNQNQQMIDSIILQLKNSTNAIEHLNRKLDHPFIGEVTLYGKKGLYKAMDDDKLIKYNANL